MIINPFAQLEVARECADNWPDLEKHFAKSAISLSRPVPGHERAIDPKVQFKNRARRTIKTMNRGRFVLRTDVSQFYPSLYTHSLEWALDGKAKAKTRLKGPRTKTRTFSQRFDRAIQNGQEGQTKGIPIGPDTSFLAAEVVMCAIDEGLQTKVKGFSESAARFYDDLEYFAGSRTEADEVLFAWESELARFELSLNADKTSINEGPVAPQPPWLAGLASIRLRLGTESGVMSYMLDYFSTAFEYAARYPKDTVISYAVQRFRNWRFTSGTWRTYSRLLLPAVVAEPSALKHAAFAFARARSTRHRIDTDRLGSTLNDIVRHHAPLGHGAEVLWSLWMLAENAISVDFEAANLVGKMGEDACALVLLHLRDRGLLLPGTDVSAVEARASSKDAMEIGDWLLAYESAHHKWATEQWVRKARGFAELLDLDVCFFNTRLRTRVPARRKPAAEKAKAKPKRRVRALAAVEY